jgi:hypothetical protein
MHLQKRYLLFISVALFGVLLIQPISSLVDDAMIEAGWCSQGQAICQLAYLLQIIGGITVVAMLSLTAYSGASWAILRYKKRIEFMPVSPVWQRDRLYLIVRNRTKSRILNCYGRIEDMFLIYADGEQSVSILSSNPNLSWEGKSTEGGRIPIDGGSKIALNIIKASGDHFAITYNDEIPEDSFSAQVPLPSGNYRINVAVYGDIGDKTIKLASDMYDAELISSEVIPDSNSVVVRPLPRYDHLMRMTPH